MQVKKDKSDEKKEQKLKNINKKNQNRCNITGEIES